jgi:hypothetical protein
MEADWEIEIGPGAPVLDAFWPEFIDLRSAPARIGEIEETRRFPALAETLLQLNGLDSGLRSDAVEDGRRLSVWTSKCDFWVLDPELEKCDPDEMDATPKESAIGLACYIDLLPAHGSDFAGLDCVRSWVRAKVEGLRRMTVRCCRADLVIRQAVLGEQDGFGITAYVTACGEERNAAEKALNSALIALVNAINEPMSNESKP